MEYHLLPFVREILSKEDNITERQDTTSSEVCSRICTLKANRCPLLSLHIGISCLLLTLSKAYLHHLSELFLVVWVFLIIRFHIIQDEFLVATILKRFECSLDQVFTS